MIIDKLVNIHTYTVLGIDTTKITAFIEQYSLVGLAEGRYDLADENLFALVQKYQTRDEADCLPESHVRYMDLQYIVKGRELLLHDFTDELAVVEDRLSTGDIRFHAKMPEKARIKLEAGMFALLLPGDAHTPCLHDGDPSEVEKIVFKIRI